MAAQQSPMARHRAVAPFIVGLAVGIVMGIITGSLVTAVFSQTILAALRALRRRFAADADAPPFEFLAQ